MSGISRLRTALAVSLLSLFGGMLAACTGAAPAGPRIQTGPNAIVSAEGLHRVDNIRAGVLYLKPDHGIGPHSEYLIGEVSLVFEPGSSPLTEHESEKIKELLAEAAESGLVRGGQPVTRAAGPCALVMNFDILDLKLKEGDAGLSGTRAVTSSGEMLLVMELSDSLSGDLLLRFGQRRALEGGIHYGGSGPDWSHIRRTFDRMLLDQRRTLVESLPTSQESDRTRRCAQTLPEAPTASR